jgi:hypothetical protein
MKKLLILFSAAFLLVSCDNAKNANDKKDEKDSADKKEEKKSDVKKPDTKGKEVLDEHFTKVDVKDLTKEDQSGWPEERKTEIKNMCLEDVGDDGKEAQAYCNCQLDNAMKIFASYKEAMTIFNKTEDELTEAEIKKLMQMEETDGNCMEQNYKMDDMEDGDEKDGM